MKTVITVLAILVSGLSAQAQTKGFKIVDLLLFDGHAFQIVLDDNETINQDSDKILSVEGLRELSKIDGEVEELIDALKVANNGSFIYGICNTVALKYNDKAEVYVDDKSVDPLVIGFTDKHWIKITSDESMKKIKSAVIGEYIWKKINNGTLLKPDFRTVRVTTTISNCKSTKH